MIGRMSKILGSDVVAPLANARGLFTLSVAMLLGLLDVSRTVSVTDYARRDPHPVCDSARRCPRRRRALTAGLRRAAASGCPEDGSRSPRPDLPGNRIGS